MGTKTFKDITTFKTGGKIAYYFSASSVEELTFKVKQIKQKKLPIFIIGEGSDILVSDRDFNGAVIKYTGNEIKNVGNRLIAEAGAIWDDLVKISVKKGLQGIERMSGIPGTVGAAPVQNIGAYGQEFSDVFFSLKAFNIEKEKIETFSKKDCKFGYRTSVFKQKSHWQEYVIISVTLKLKKGNKKSLKEIRKEILDTRQKKLEDYKKVPNAGSFFMNPFLNLKEKERLQKILPDTVFYKQDKMYKVSAGFLIEKAGWKGRRLGPVKVSGKHALILTNPKGKGKTSDILKLAKAIQSDVYEKFGINLKPEVQYISTLVD